MGIKIVNRTKQKDWDITVSMTREAPTLIRNDDKFELVNKTFPVAQFPNARLSDVESGPPAEGSNSQIVEIYKKKTWASGFKDFPVLIPMTSFKEYAYWGTNAGWALNFSMPDEQLFFAAAIIYKAKVPAIPPNAGFALLTHTASEQMLQDHHRLIVIFRAEHALGYLALQTVEERLAYCLRHRYVANDLHISRDKLMAKDWTKRVKLQTDKRDEELIYRQVLDEHGRVQ